MGLAQHRLRGLGNFIFSVHRPNIQWYQRNIVEYVENNKDKSKNKRFLCI